jgi:ArsR family transcriptional regulator
MKNTIKHIEIYRCEEALMESKYENNAKVFKALCDPNRLIIIENLQSGEKCACKILEDLNIGQPTLSHHMKILCESGLVTCRRQGKWMHYSIDEAGCERAKKLLEEITAMAISTVITASK